MTPAFRFQTAGAFLSGAGSSMEIGPEIRNLEIERPFIITDPGVAEAGILDRVAGGLKEAGLLVTSFQEVSADPSVEVVGAAAKAFREAEADCIIGLGGGSSIDAAKVAAVVAVNGGSATDYEGARDSFPSLPPRLIAIPTTAGTGSEAGSAAVITNLESKDKFVVKGPGLFARLAVLDPDLLAGLPPHVAAHSSLDALSHIVESYVSVRRTPLTETLALGAARRWALYVRRYLQDRSDSVAAENMIQASSMAGMSMSNAGLGLVHALAHPFGALTKIPHGGALTKIPHGAVCAMFMPHVIRFNDSEGGQGYGRLAEVLAPALWPDEKTPGKFSGEALADGIATLVDEVGIPHRLAESAVLPETKMEAILGSVQCQTNPGAVNRESVLAVWQQVL
jgi:alcohol dehydrogenase class IV